MFRTLSLLLFLAFSILPSQSHAATAAEIEAETDLALARLAREAPVAEKLMADAAGILVFPSIIKGGFGIGGQYGEGALRKGGKTTAYYNIASVSYGLQIGAQGYSQVLIFTTPEKSAVSRRQPRLRNRRGCRRRTRRHGRRRRSILDHTAKPDRRLRLRPERAYGGNQHRRQQDYADRTVDKRACAARTRVFLSFFSNRSPQAGAQATALSPATCRKKEKKRGFRGCNP